MKTSFRSPGTIVLSVLLLLLIATGIANAAATIGSAQIKDGSVKSVDVKNNNLTAADLAPNSVGSSEATNNSLTSTDIKDGSIGSQDLSAAAQSDLTKVSGPNWSVVDRNTINGGDSFLRAGPSSAVPPEIAPKPPYGVGSLGLRTGVGGTNADKAAFGNQVDFLGNSILGITTLNYWVFTTGENIANGNGGATPNLPSLSFEINPNLSSTASGFSTLVFIPGPAQAGRWTQMDTVASGGQWGLTGAAGTATGCSLSGTLCNWDAIKAALDDGGEPPTMYTVQLQKGRDFVYSGAVDGLQINDTVYDFEPNGVFTTTAATRNTTAGLRSAPSLR